MKKCHRWTNAIRGGIYEVHDVSCRCIDVENDRRNAPASLKQGVNHDTLVTCLFFQTD